MSLRKPMDSITDIAISVSGLSFSYGTNAVLNQVSLSVGQGEVLGLLGPNGAGKTTLLHILATLLKPRDGGVTYFGIAASDDLNGVRGNLCLIPQERAVDILLTVAGNLKLYALLQHVRANRIQEITRKAAVELDLVPHLRKTVFQLSGGLIRRLQFANALISEAPILLLDEPTLGIDPEGRRRIWNLIRDQAKDKGRTVIIATNDMGEADALCDRVVFLRHGTTAAVESPERLKALSTATVVRVQTSPVFEQLPQVSNVPGLVDMSIDHGVLQVGLTGLSGNLLTLLYAVQDSGRAIESVNVRPPSLEDAFAALVSHSLGREVAQE